MKTHFKYVFVVLVYRNLDVVLDFFKSLKIEDYKVIIIESFFDNKTTEQCKNLSNDYNADFIPIPNNGYGAGNNVGIDYALSNYKFDYLIVSNSDIIIEDITELENLKLARESSFVIAPRVKRVADGKLQNPNIVKDLSLYYKLMEFGYTKDSILSVTCAHIISRLQRELFRIISKLFKRQVYKIFSAHGSFIIFSYEAAKNLTPVFNEHMFLYNEELFLGFKCKKADINIYYCPKIKVLHLEGASTSNKDTEFKISKQSFLELNQWKSNM